MEAVTKTNMHDDGNAPGGIAPGAQSSTSIRKAVAISLRAETNSVTKSGIIDIETRAVTCAQRVQVYDPSATHIISPPAQGDFGVPATV